MKASVVEGGSAAEAKVVSVMQMFRRDVWAVVNKRVVGVIVENIVQIRMRDVSVLGRVGWREGVREGVAVRKGTIIHRVMNR